MYGVHVLFRAEEEVQDSASLAYVEVVHGHERNDGAIDMLSMLEDPRSIAFHLWQERYVVIPLWAVEIVAQAV